MTTENQELLLDLLIKQATEGLDEAEKTNLDVLGGTNNYSVELAAAALTVVDIDAAEPLPFNLRAKIEDRADEWFSGLQSSQVAIPANPIARDEVDEMQPTFEFEPRRSIFSWLGWAVAAAACVALAINIAMTRFQPIEQASNTPPAIQKPNPSQAHDDLLAQAGTIKATWAPGGKDAELASLSGDVVWNDEKQIGYMKFRGLPVNDRNKTTYQLWIFEENQGKETPIDGGTFDVDINGDVVIPINAKLRAKNPALFAVTVEKPGGVVISKKDKIAAIAKVETQGKTST